MPWRHVHTGCEDRLQRGDPVVEQKESYQVSWDSRGWWSWQSSPSQPSRDWQQPLRQWSHSRWDWDSQSWDWREQQPASDAHQQQQHWAAAGQHQQTTSAAAGSSSNSWCAGISQPEATQQDLVQNLPAVADLTLQAVSMQTSRMLPSIMMNTMCHNLCLDTEVVCAHTVTLWWMLSCYTCVPLQVSLGATEWFDWDALDQAALVVLSGWLSFLVLSGGLSFFLAPLLCVVAACLSEMPGGGRRLLQAD